MKKAVAVILLLLMTFALNACTETSKETETTSAVNTEVAQTTEEAQSEEQTNEMKVNININGKTFTATLEDNTAAKELYEIIKNEKVIKFTLCIYLNQWDYPQKYLLITI